jgi:hypothetical protein
LQAQAGLTGATGAGESQQTHLSPPQEPARGGTDLLPPEERRGLHGQVVGVMVEAPEGWEVARQVRDDELIQALGAL